jgi:hypothetical protein
LARVERESVAFVARATGLPRKPTSVLMPCFAWYAGSHFTPRKPGRGDRRNRTSDNSRFRLHGALWLLRSFSDWLHVYRQWLRPRFAGARACSREPSLDCNTGTAGGTTTRMPRRPRCAGPS